MQELEKELNELGIIIDKFVNSGNSSHKRNFTNKVNKIAYRYGASYAKGHLVSFMKTLSLLYPYNERFETLCKRIIPGRPFTEQSSTGKSHYEMGFHSETQVQAERLPLSVSSDSIIVNLYGFRKSEVPWLKNFSTSIELPYIIEGIYSPTEKTIRDKILNVYEDLCIVQFHLIFQNMTFVFKSKNKDIHTLITGLYVAFYPLVSVEYIFMTPRPIQYHYDLEPGYYSELIVYENVKQLGFWNSYNLFDNCQKFYKREHPEWFNSDNWHWGLDARFDIGTVYGDNIWLTLDEASSMTKTTQIKPIIVKRVHDGKLQYKATYYGEDCTGWCISEKEVLNCFENWVTAMFIAYGL